MRGGGYLHGRPPAGAGRPQTASAPPSAPQCHVFVNQYLVIKDLGRGAHGSVKLVYSTEDDRMYAMKARRMHACMLHACMHARMRACAASMRPARAQHARAQRACAGAGGG